MESHEFHRRHLPHWDPGGVPIFLTWTLKGCLPEEVMERLREERRRWEKRPPRRGETAAERRIREDKLFFLAVDRFLDRPGEGFGPMHLKDPNAAAIVEESILHGAGERYDLLAWCVMSNHVHVLLKPRWKLSEVTRGIKGYTAHRINGLLGTRGRTLWQDESYDHWARDESAMMRIIDYIENNPVAAGLCRRPEDWPASSARFRYGWARGEAYPSS